MNESNTAPLTQENSPALQRALSENGDRGLIPGAVVLPIEATASTEAADRHESYERATALKSVGLYSQAIEHFEKSAEDPAYTLKSFAHMGLCLKQERKTGRSRRGLSPSPTSPLDIIERTNADPLPLRENVRVTRTHS